MAIRFHLDEHVDEAIAIELRKHGIDVTTTVDAGLRGADDIDQSVFERTMNIIVKHRTDLDVVAERVGVKLTGGIVSERQAG